MLYHVLPPMRPIFMFELTTGPPTMGATEENRYYEPKLKFPPLTVCLWLLVTDMQTLLFPEIAGLNF